MPDEVLDQEILDAQPLVTAQMRDYQRDAPIFFATSPGAVAYGNPDGISPFTQALLQALDGSAAEQLSRGRWEVRTDRLIHAINMMLAWNRSDGGPTQRAVVEGLLSGSTLRVLASPPQVPFRLGTTPAEALPTAHLSIHHPRSNETVLERHPHPSVWEDNVTANWYKVRARFRRSGYRDRAIERALDPPCVTDALEVD